MATSLPRALNFCIAFCAVSGFSSCKQLTGAPLARWSALSADRVGRLSADADQSTQSVTVKQVQAKALGANAAASERDRFVGFAFAGADVLIEADSSGLILFAAGACQTVMDATAGDLFGADVCGLFSPAYQPAIRSMIASSAAGGRFGPLFLRTEAGASVELSLCRLPTTGSNVYFAVSARTNGDADAPLNNQDQFIDRALDAAKTESDAAITLVNLRGAGLSAENADPALKRELDAAVAVYLQASAMSPNAAGKMGDGRFGIIHSEEHELDQIMSELESVVTALNPALGDVTLQAESLPAGELRDNPELARQALRRAIDEFCNQAFQSESGALRRTFKNSIAEATNRIAWLTQVLESRRFGISAQPIVSLADSSVHHVEILCRFQEDASPFELISFAENTDLIQDLDAAVLTAAASAMAAGKIPAPQGAAVNVSGISIESSAFLAHVLEIYRKTPELSGRLLIEITESARITDLESARGFVGSLREAGVQVCLDDFGAGASSFPYLQTLDVDCVKIDGVYIGRMMTNSKDRLLVKALADLCHALGIVTVAEYVEDAAQVAALKDLNIQYGQGFYFGAPEPLIAAPRDGASAAPA